jgi:hypothetical protein
MAFAGTSYLPLTRSERLSMISGTVQSRFRISTGKKLINAFVAAKDGITRTNPSERAQITARIIRVVIKMKSMNKLNHGNTTTLRKIFDAIKNVARSTDLATLNSNCSLGA